MSTIKLKHTFATILLTLSFVTASAQGGISGRVFDAKTGEAIEYASIALLNPQDSGIVTGTVSEHNGSFAIKPKYGSYIVRISFMGYTTYFHPNTITLNSKHPNANLGKIGLTPSAKTMDEVVVTAERTMVEYQLDKRVVNVDKNIVSGGGTATDVLENVPSVAIDNDGNVTLRGSTNVKVLIDGRPSELLGANLESLLEQIPASTVENVEIITNPSAKYDPEGMSGIINIKLKDKNSGALGLNGLANINIGSPVQEWLPTTMATININYNTPKYAITFAADGGQRARGMYGTTDIARIQNGVAYQHDSLFEHRIFPNQMASSKLGFEYYFNKNNSLLINYQLRSGNRIRKGTINATDLLGIDMDYIQSDTSLSRSLNHVIGLNYTHKFEKPEQVFTIDATLNLRKMNGEGDQEVSYADYFSNLNHYYLRHSIQENHHENINVRVNYNHPLKNDWKFETGYEGRISFPNQNSKYYITNYDSTGILATHLDNNSSTHYVSQQQTHAIYATVGGSIIEGLSMQAGLRGEYSLVEGHDINHPDMQRVYKSYPQIYPTLHASYQINKIHSTQLSYSRRVRRPNMWDLNPYLDVREGQQMSFGNPNLAPEFTNALELSYNVALDKINLYTCLYYRQTDSMMTRYGFVWDESSASYYSPWMPYDAQYDGYWASAWQNLNKGRNYGMEFILDYQILKWWKINVSINLYESTIEGTELLQNQDKKAFQASGKFNTYMTLPKNWTIQISGQYWAPWLDLQTEMFSNKWADLAIKKDILRKQGTLNLRIGNIFHTAGFGHYTNTPQLDRLVTGRRLGPTVTIGFSYKINNGLKQKSTQAEYDDSSSDSEY